MDVPVSNLILVVSSVLLSLVVVEYAIGIFDTMLDTSEYEDIQRLRDMLDEIRAQTDDVVEESLNQTAG